MLNIIKYHFFTLIYLRILIDGVSERKNRKWAQNRYLENRQKMTIFWWLCEYFPVAVFYLLCLNLIYKHNIKLFKGQTGSKFIWKKFDFCEVIFLKKMTIFCHFIGKSEKVKNIFYLFLKLDLSERYRWIIKIQVRGHFFIARSDR